MLSLALLAAGAPIPPPLTADQDRQLRCVAVLGVLAGAQERGAAAALDLPPLAEQGGRFAQAVGEAIVRDSGRTQEQVRDLIVTHVATVQAGRADEGSLARQAKACVAVMDATVPRSPPAADADPLPLPEPAPR